MAYSSHQVGSASLPPPSHTRTNHHPQMCYTDQEGEPGKNNHTKKGSCEFLKYEQTWFSFESQDRQILLFCSRFPMGDFFLYTHSVRSVHKSLAISCYLKGKKYWNLRFWEEKPCNNLGWICLQGPIIFVRKVKKGTFAIVYSILLKHRCRKL